jgi:hypothetical protein
MEKKSMNIVQTIKIMELRLETWERQKAGQNASGKRVDVCLIASIVDIKDDIKTMKRALRLINNYNHMFELPLIEVA